MADRKFPWIQIIKEKMYQYNFENIKRKYLILHFSAL